MYYKGSWIIKVYTRHLPACDTGLRRVWQALMQYYVVTDCQTIIPTNACANTEIQWTGKLFNTRFQWLYALLYY